MQLGDRREDRRRVRELGKDHEPHGQERRGAGERLVDHRQHAIGVRAHVGTGKRVLEVGLAGSSGITDHFALPANSSIGTTGLTTTRVCDAAVSSNARRTAGGTSVSAYG